MKKILLMMFITLFALCFVFSGCQGDADDKGTEAPENTEEQIAEEQPEQEDTAEQPEQEDMDNKQVLEYLSLLGLDETCDYELSGTFPSNVANKKMYLVSVFNITEVDFAAIENKLQENGFVIISDIYTDEERQARSYPYSNNDNLYIEIVFSYGAKYFDVTFNPIA